MVVKELIDQKFIVTWLIYYFTSLLQPFTKRQIFRLVQTESICRRQSKCNVKKKKFFWELVENIIGKGENAGYQHFLLFLQCFQKVSFTGSLKVGIVW